MATFQLSDETVNSYGFIVDIKNLKLDRFKANPVMLYNHDKLVGKWEKIRIENGVLYGDSVFMEDKDETEALKVKKRVDNGFVKGASLGIHIQGWIELEGEPPRAIAEVLEASPCDIPSNANSLVLFDADGVKLSAKEIQLAVNKITKPKPKRMKLSATTLKILGLDGTPTESQIEEAVNKLDKKSNELKDESAMQKLTAENAKLNAKIEATQTEKVDALLTAAITDGRIKEGQKDRYQKLAANDFELAKETLDSLPKRKKLSGSEEQENKNKNTKERKDWSFQDWRRKDTKGLLSIKKTDPERYQEIINS